jgi:2-(1,2-epoxy-1,2-dihydrophenyl)acetyl-CoA isomerase
MCCDEDAEIRSVLLTGSGKLFCAGGDLKAFAAYADELPGAIEQMVVYLHAALSHFAHLDAPLVVAVNGSAAGAGIDLLRRVRRLRIGQRPRAEREPRPPAQGPTRPA